MSTLFLLLVLAQPQSDVNWSGQILTTVGDVELQREQRRSLPAFGTRVLVDDTLSTPPAGGAALIMSSGAVVYLGPNTTIKFNNGRDEGLSRIEMGEARVSATRQAVKIEFPDGAATLGRGAALRIQASNNGVRLWSETGTAQLALADSKNVNLAAGRELTIDSNGQVQGPIAANNQGWTLDVQQLQLQVASEAARRRRPPAGEQRDQESQQTDPNQQREDEPPSTSDRSSSNQSDDATSTQTQSAAAAAVSGASGFSAAPGITASAGLFSDAAQATLEGKNVREPGTTFPGNIHLVTGESRYAFSSVRPTSAERAAMFPGGNPAYYSIGVGSLPTGQVTTDFNTATNATPYAVKVPKFDAYIVRLDQYGPIDAGLDPAGAANSNVGYAGLLGTDPSAPTVTGATPLNDKRAKFNEKATFALGEIRTRPDGGTSGDNYEVAVRRSDQDRTIVKDQNNNDAKDKVNPNLDVGAFDDVADPRFQPAAPTVKVPRPGTYNSKPTRFSQLDILRRAAVTTTMADQLHDYARRTGQTRFAIDGKVIDISGYRRK